MKPHKPKLTIGNIAAIAVVIYLGVLLAGVVRRNYDLQHQVANLEAQIRSLADEKDQLAYKVQYYQTDSFKEKEARAKLGLQAPGEGVIILPRNQPAAGVSTPTKPAVHKSNWQLWKEFLLG